LAIYDSIGKDYNTNRAADSRIVAAVKDLLNLPRGATIADIGAGTGNYANAIADLGYKVEAVEPSQEIRNQAKPNRSVRWQPGIAEAIPLENNSVNGVIVVLALHHFSDVMLAANEITRICPEGPIVILTIDPRESEPFWFYDYFPEIRQWEYTIFPPINEIARSIVAVGKWRAEITKFPLPRDLADRNMCSGWGTPETYLDKQMRQNTSGFTLASREVVDQGVEQLRNDLQSGAWDKKYSSLRIREYFDAGFRFLRFGTNLTFDS
jgi:ubiquinone/menaquinone biosynthesis C-methylase UbiE